MTTIDLRPAAPDDYDFAFRVHCAAMRPSVERVYGWDEDWQARYFQEYFDPARLQIIRYGGTDIGYISIDEQRGHFFLAMIAILPAYQGRRIGTTLIRRLQQKAQRKALTVTLRVLKGNPARALYERLGFEVTGETDTHYRMKWYGMTDRGRNDDQRE